MNTELKRQNELHKDRQLRMLKAANSNGEVERLQRQLRMKEMQLKSLQHEMNSKVDKIKYLSIELADCQARVLAQAKIICERDNEDELNVSGGHRPVVEIVQEVLKDFPGTTVDDIISLRRSRWLIEPRHKAFYEVYRQRPDLSFPQIGKFFRRDHTTILHGVDKYRSKDHASEG